MGGRASDFQMTWSSRLSSDRAVPFTQIFVEYIHGRPLDLQEFFLWATTLQYNDELITKKKKNKTNKQKPQPKA